MKTLSYTFDKEAAWRKVRDRRVVVLDMNCWINMGDDKFPMATEVKGSLRSLVSGGFIFCPLSFGLICELYKQAEESRLRIGALMEELSLNISYASREEIFAWEVERGVRRLADAGPIDLSLSELYVPLIGYLSSRFQLEFADSWPSEELGAATKGFRGRLEALALTDLLKIRARNRRDGIFEAIKKVPVPKYSEESERTWQITKGDKGKTQRIEAEAVFRLYIKPALAKLPPPVLARFWEYGKTVARDKYGGFLGELLKSLPAMNNHVKLMAALSQNPKRKDKINDFFDFEIMPVPLAYASVFCAQDKGIRDLLLNRTDILKHVSCRYCFDLAELQGWLKAEGLG